MKNLIVGDKDCSINKIVSKISRLKQSQLLAGEWIKLAIELDAPNTKMVEWEQDLLFKRKGILAVLIDLLTHWRSSLGNNAKFEHLLNIIGNECGWKDVEDDLWKTFQSDMTEDITWEDLDARSRHQIMESSVVFQGESTTLKNICSHFDESEVETMLQSKLPGAMILKLLRGERITLAGGSIPETPAFYVNRNLVSRQRLNPEIFKHKCSDIFVIKGISLSELSNIAGNESIAKTSNQQYKLISRYIQLDLPDGFEIIAGLSNYAPVHQLSFKGENFYWVKSSGSVGLIQEYKHDDQDSVSEEDFLSVLQQEYSKSLPVCIAGIPGMGKTCLLANLARQRRRHAGNKSLVLFIALSQFLDEANESVLDQDVCTDKIFNCITKFISQNELGQEIVSKMLNNGSYFVEIYFDGYDELPEHKQELTAKIIKCLLNTGKHIRTAITTRVHKRRQLEETLKVLSFNIKSFPPDDQAQLLKQLWSNKYGVPSNDNLHRFANHVADQIRMTLSPKSNDVIGVAIQCSMLADIFASDALRYSGADSLPLELSTNIRSVHNMYSALMEKRFGACKKDKQIPMRNFHVLAAIHAVLPECLPVFRGGKSLQALQLNEINSVGILTAERIGSSVTTQFLHHSYAEYLLAKFLVENLEQKGETGNDIFESVSKLDLFWLACCVTEDDSQIRVDTPDCTFFTLWKGICKSGDEEKLRKNWESLAKELQISDLDIIAIRAKVKNNISRGGSEASNNSLCMLLHHWTQNIKARPKLRQLLDALRSMELYELAENLKSAYAIPSFEHQYLCFFINEALHQKQVSLSLNTSEYTLLKQSSELMSMLPACLYHNYFNLFALISQQLISIIKTDHPNASSLHKTFFLRLCPFLILLTAKYSDLNLVTGCCDFVESVLECKLNEIETLTTHDFLCYGPLHAAANRGDFTMFHYFFKKFAPVVLEKKYLLHYCVQDSLANSEQVIGEKIQIIEMITKFINEIHHAPSGCSPILMEAINIKLLKHMIDAGADVKATDRDYGDTVVHLAARYLSPTDFHSFVEFLLEREETAVFHMCNKNYKSTPVHYAAYFLDVEPKTIQLLSSKLGVDCFNNRDWEGDTALFCAVSGLRKRQTLEMMVKCGGLPKRLRKDQQTIIHLAAIFGNVDAIGYFVFLGCNVNARDVHGRTALHLAFDLGLRSVGNIVKTLLDNNADANVKDAHGRKAIWYAEKEDKLWMLEPDTMELLEQSNRKPCTYL